MQLLCAFPSPYGEIYFKFLWCNRILFLLYRFRPLTGRYISNKNRRKEGVLWLSSFPSPYGEIYFKL